MFDIGWAEMLVISIVLIVVVGPKDLPKMLRAFGKTTAKVRGMAGEFRKQFDDAMKEAELEDLKSIADDARKLNPAGGLKKALSPMEKAAQDVRSGLDKAMKPSTASKPASAEPRPADPLKAGATAMPGETTSKGQAGAAGKPNGGSAPQQAPAGKTANAAPAAAKSKTVAKPKTAAKSSAASKPAPSTKTTRAATPRKRSAAPKSGGDAS